MVSGLSPQPRSSAELANRLDSTSFKIPPNHPIIPHPITPIKRRLIGDRPLHRPPRQGVINDRARDAAGFHGGDVFPAGGLVGATA